jgi:hypothetical protein
MFCLKSSPFSHIGGPKGEALHLSIESNILGSLHNFNFFWQWANQIGSLQNKKGWNCEAPPTKKNKYSCDIHHQTPQETYVIFVDIKINAMYIKKFL